MTHTSRLSCVVACLLLAGLSEVQPVSGQTIVTSIRIKSLNQVAKDIDTLATQFNAPPMGTMALGYLTGLAGNSAGTGVDMDKAAFGYVLLGESGAAGGGMMPMMAPPLTVVVIPLAGDGSAFLAGLTESFSSQTTEGELTKLSAPVAGLPGARSQMFVGREAGYAVVGDDPAATAKILARMKETFPASPEDTFSVTLGVQSLMPLLDTAFAMGKMATSSGMSAMPGADGAPTMDPGKMAAAQLDMVRELIQQVDSLNIRMSAGPKALELTSYATLVPDTLLAEVQGAFVPVSDRYRSLVAPNALVSVAGNGMQVFSAHTEDYLRLMRPFMEVAGASDPTIMATFEEQVSLIKGAYSGDWSFSVVPSPTGVGIGAMEFVATQDSKRAKDAVVKGALGGQKMGSMAAMDISVKENARTFRGHDITHIVYTPKSDDDLGQNMTAAMDSIPLAKLFLSSEVAFLDDMVVMTWGGTEIMDAALSLVESGGMSIETAAPFSDLFPSYGQAPITLVSARILSLIKGVMQMAPTGAGTDMSSVFPDSTSGVAAHTYMHEGKQVTVLKVGYNELVNIGKAATQIQQATMGAMPGMNDPSLGEVNGSDGDPTVTCLNQLRMIDAAKELCVMEEGLAAGEVLSIASIQKYLPGGMMPQCPLGNDYTLGTVGQPPTCPAEGHELP